MSNLNKNNMDYNKKYPWLSHYYCARSRCEKPNNASYKNYGGKGIKFKLTKEQIKKLWIRDNANNLDRPSIDRKYSYKDYTFSNCRFIELSNNCSQNSKTIIQYSLEEHHIRMWKSASAVERQLGFNRHNINRCCRKERPTAFGFIWRYYKG